MAGKKRRFTATQSAQMVGIAYSTMRKHIQAGRVSAKRKGRSLWITEAELRRSYPDAFSAIEDLESADAPTKGADPRPDSAIESADASMEGADSSADSAIESADPESPVTERDSSDIEVEILRTKLMASEQQAEHLRR